MSLRLNGVSLVSNGKKKYLKIYIFFVFFFVAQSFFFNRFFFLTLFFLPSHSPLLSPFFSCFYYYYRYFVIIFFSMLCSFHWNAFTHVHVLYPPTLHLSHLLHSSLQFVDRLSLFFMPLKYQPDYIYLRHVGIKKVYLFTFIQLMCLVVLWVIKSTDAAIVFPIMVSHGDLEP